MKRFVQNSPLRPWGAPGRSAGRGGARHAGAACGHATGSAGSRSGFSLVEILIATAILLVIVMMVSIVFQQQSGAIQAGQDRIKGQAALRNTIGIAVRDLSLAVDSADYPDLEKEKKKKNTFSQGSASFLATTGDPAENGTALQWIQYQNSGGVVSRTVTQIEMKDGKFSTGKSETADINDSANRLRQFKFDASDSGTFPDSVTVLASFQGSGNASLVSGVCAGRDKQFGTDDDIYAGRGKDGL